MYKLACVINAIAPSQCSVERSFSTLALAYNERRNRLTTNHLENIVIANTNASLVHRTFDVDMAKLKLIN